MVNLNRKYKALMLDIDGTLIANSKESMPSPRVVDAILNAHEKVAVCLVTARHLYETEPIIDTLKINNLVVLLGGSQIYDAKSKTFIYEQPINAEDIPKIFEVLKPYNIKIKIRESDKAVEYQPGYILERPFIISIIHTTEENTDLIASKLTHIFTISTHKIISWKKGTFNLNIVHAIATKQHGILEIARLLHIDTQDMIAVGDGPNDFPLLMACGLKVAMGNAHPDLKAIADYIAPSVEDDGVADVIEKFIL